MRTKVTIHDSGFTAFARSASLREDNAAVRPTHIKWTTADVPGPDVYTGGDIKHVGTQPAIAWLLEPPHLRPENYWDAYGMRDEFAAILTYDRELIERTDRARFYPFGGSSIAFDDWRMYPKSKDVCMILSGKQTTEGHRLRHRIAGRYGHIIDCYGAGVGRPFERKLDVLRDYKYAVVVESGRSDWYFTEKLIDAFAAGCVPIYWGCPDITYFFDIQGMRLFSTIGELGGIFRGLGDNPKPPYRNHEIAKGYRICEDRPEFLYVVLGSEK